MPWFKVDDGFSTSRKVIQIPRRDRFQVIGLWTMAGNFAARELTNGHIPAYVLDELGAPDEAVEMLVQVGLWDRDEQGEIWFHDWCEYQPSAAEYLEKRKEISEKRANAANKRWSNAKAMQTDANAMQNVCPEPEPEPLTSNEVSIKRRATRLPENFEVTQEMKDWAKEKHPLVDIETATANFIDYWASKPTGATKLDWVATWRTWIRNTKTTTVYKTTADLKLDRNRQARDNFLALAAQAEEQKQIANPDWA